MLIRLIAFTFLEEKTHLALLSQITSTSKIKFSLSDKLVSQDKSQEESLKWTQIFFHSNFEKRTIRRSRFRPKQKL